MKNLFSSFATLVAGAVCALSLGSCNRAEYAMLPQGASYHHTTRPTTPVPAAKATDITAVTTPATATPAPAIEAAPAAPTAAPAVAAAPVASPAAVALSEAPAAAVAPAQAAPAVKLNAFQRLALSKVTKKLQKAAQKVPAFDKKENTAKTQAISGKLRQGLILLLVGLLVGVVAGVVGGSVGNLIGLIGLILVIIGVVLIILYLLDEL